LAAEKNLDLVEVAANADPPVCRIMDYGKYKYEQSKKEKEAKKKQRSISVKEVRMTPKIEKHDFDFKVRNAERFLKSGDKVKISVRFRGREIVHSHLARTMLQELAEKVGEVGRVEKPPRMEGRFMVMWLVPHKELAPHKEKETVEK